MMSMHWNKERANVAFQASSFLLFFCALKNSRNLSHHWHFLLPVWATRMRSQESSSLDRWSLLPGLRSLDFGFDTNNMYIPRPHNSDLCSQIAYLCSGFTILCRATMKEKWSHADDCMRFFHIFTFVVDLCGSLSIVDS